MIAELPVGYFGWGEGSPVLHAIKYLFIGEGDIGPVTREVLRRAEPHPQRRPAVHMG